MLVRSWGVEFSLWTDLQPLIDQELNGLPESYRLPILLCDLGGKTIKEATHQLGWPQGTLAGRLARGRKLLAKRLARRGWALPHHDGGADDPGACRGRKLRRQSL